MNNQKSPLCEGAPYELAKRFIGIWQEFTVKEDKEILEGKLETRFELESCVLTQRFSSVNGTFSFLSFGYVEPETNTWYETYVFNSGRFAHWRWHEAGEEVIMNHIDGHGETRRRLRVVNLKADSYEVIDERLAESGNIWEFVMLTRTKRIGE